MILENPQRLLSLWLATLLAGCGVPGSLVPEGVAGVAVVETFDAGRPPGPLVENLEPGERVRHPWVLLEGSTDAGSVIVSTGATAASWPANEGRFKAIAPLIAGENTIALEAGEGRTELSLTYAPQTNRRFLRFIYLLAADGTGDFEAPPGEPNDTASAIARIQTTARLLQLLTAESMHRQGFGRKTFRVEEELDGSVKVHVLRTSLTTEEAHAMSSNERWSHYYGELGSLPSRADSIDVVIQGMSRRDPSTGELLAGGALGGGRLGMFHSATLHTYAASLEEVAWRFLDDRVIDTAQLIDDSASRGTHWANYATGLGATLHEIGHTLSLPHPLDHKGVMSREFDHVNRTLTVAEPDSLRGPGLERYEDSDLTGHFGRSDTVRLAFHRFLAIEDETYAVNAAPSISPETDTVTVQSAAGLRHLLFLVDGRGGNHREFLEQPPLTLTVTQAELRSLYPDATEAEFSVIDDDGNIATRTVTLNP